MPEDDKRLMQAVEALSDEQLETFARLLDVQANLIRQMKPLGVNGRVVLAGQYTETAAQIGRLWMDMLGLKVATQ